MKFDFEGLYFTNAYGKLSAKGGVLLHIMQNFSGKHHGVICKCKNVFSFFLLIYLQRGMPAFLAWLLDTFLCVLIDIKITFFSFIQGATAFNVPIFIV